jgi:hypothetical protein
VVGLVLVDAAHPDMGVRLVAGLPPAAQGEPESIKAWRQYLTWTADSDGREPGNQEGWNTGPATSRSGPPNH